MTTVCLSFAQVHRLEQVPATSSTQHHPTFKDSSSGILMLEPKSICFSTSQHAHMQTRYSAVFPYLCTGHEHAVAVQLLVPGFQRPVKHTGSPQEERRRCNQALQAATIILIK